MKVCSYLVFNGSCQQAIDFYKEALGSPKVEIMRFSEMPASPENPPFPESANNLVLHAEMQVGEDVIYLSDNCPGCPYDGKNGDLLSITLCGISVSEAQNIYGKLRLGGKDIMPLGKTFWSPAYAMIIDKFGVKWSINAE